MRYTTYDRGLLNNYAVEPVVYAAEYPSEAQQQQYLFQGALAVLLVLSLFMTALSIS
jgi:hypothetical protein